jgi:hypothetical protein
MKFYPWAARPDLDKFSEYEAVIDSTNWNWDLDDDGFASIVATKPIEMSNSQLGVLAKSK